MTGNSNDLSVWLRLAFIYDGNGTVNAAWPLYVEKLFFFFMRAWQELVLPAKEKFFIYFKKSYIQKNKNKHLFNIFCVERSPKI